MKSECELRIYAHHHRAYAARELHRRSHRGTDADADFGGTVRSASQRLRDWQVHDRLDPLPLRIEHRITHDAHDSALHVTLLESRVGDCLAKREPSRHECANECFVHDDDR